MSDHASGDQSKYPATTWGSSGSAAYLVLARDTA